MEHLLPIISGIKSLLIVLLALILFMNLTGTRDSTSTQCALETSSRALRMLTESGDSVRYVSFRSAGLSGFILVDGGGCGPVFLCRGFWDWGFAKAAMSLGQSPLAMSYGVGMGGWTVRYGGVKSHDSGMAIVYDGELESCWVVHTDGSYDDCYALCLP